MSLTLWGIELRDVAAGALAVGAAWAFVEATRAARARRSREGVCEGCRRRVAPGEWHRCD